MGCITDMRCSCRSRSWPLLLTKVFCRTLPSPAHVLPLGLRVPWWAQERQEGSQHLRAPGPVAVRSCAGDLLDITVVFPGTDADLGSEGSPPPPELLTQNDLQLRPLMPIFFLTTKVRVTNSRKKNGQTEKWTRERFDGVG